MAGWKTQKNHCKDNWCHKIVRMKTMYEEIPKLLQSLADRFCERRAYSCLLAFLPAYFSPNGLTDGWKDCRKALADTKALRDQLKPDEEKDLHTAMNLIDRMLADR